jgi:hypothetical protein
VPSTTPANVVEVLPAEVSVFVALVELSVTFAPDPVPDVVIEATVSSYPDRSNTALSAIETADESEMRPPAAPSFSVPDEIVVVPVYVFSPDNVKVSEPAWVSAPTPETTPAYVIALLRLKMIVPEFTTLAVAIEPADDPAPTLTVPAEMVSAPSNVFAPVKVNVPVPCFVTLPLEPSMTPANVVEPLPAEVSVFAVLVVLRMIFESAPVPAVAMDATASSNPARSNVALSASDRAEVSAILFDAPRASTPADTVVVPV